MSTLQQWEKDDTKELAGKVSSRQPVAWQAKAGKGLVALKLLQSGGPANEAGCEVDQNHQVMVVEDWHDIASPDGSRFNAATFQSCQAPVTTVPKFKRLFRATLTL